MRVIAIFGLHGGLNLAVQLLILVLVALWLALAFWTYADARRRVEDPMLVACAAAGSLFFPFVGAIVYAIVRPPEYLEDVRERELEIAAAEARLAQVDALSCPHCGFEVEKTFLRCPNCMHKLKEPCSTCGRPLDPRWKICPYCESEVTTTAAAPQRRRPVRRAAPAAGTPAAERSAAPARPRASDRVAGEQPARRASTDPA
jgi:double zinc ribbon protein